MNFNDGKDSGLEKNLFNSEKNGIKEIESDISDHEKEIFRKTKNQILMPDNILKNNIPNKP